MSDSSVTVKTPYGEYGTVPQDQLGEALKVGYVVPSNEEITGHNNHIQYGTGFANTAKAFGAGALRGGSFGLSDEALTGSGAAHPETLKQLKEQNPIASTLGEVTGIGASALLAPEVSPVGLVGKLGSGIAEAATPVIGEGASLAGRILAKAPAAALGSAVEGGLYGAGQAVTENALGDTDLNAQKVLAHVGMGALLGGAFGAGLKGLELGLPETVESAQKSLTKFNDYLKGDTGVGPLGRAYAQTSSFVSGKPYEQILEGIRNRGSLIENPETRQAMASEFSGNLSEHFDQLKNAVKVANKDIRPQEIDNLLKDVPAQAPKDTMINTVSEMRNMAQKMRDEPDLYSAYYPRTLESIADRIGPKVTADSTASDIYKELNSLKQRLDQDIPYGKMVSPADQLAVREVKTLRGAIKDTLESQELWGEAGARQAAFNDAQREFQQLTGGVNSAFKKHFLEKTSTAGGSLAYKISPTKVATFLKQTNSINGEVKAQALSDFIDTSHKLLNEIESTYKSTPASASFNKQDISRLIDKSKSVMSENVKQAELAKNLGYLGGGAHNSYLGEHAAIGFGLHNPVLGAGIEAFSLARNPALAIQRLSKIEKMVNKTTNLINKSTSALFKTGVKVSDEYTGYLAGVKVSDEYAGYLGAKLGQPSKEEHADVVKTVNEFASNPEKFINHLDEVTRSSFEAAPKITGSMHQAVSTAIGFLSSKIPRDPNLKMLSQKYEPSKAEIDLFNRYYTVVEDPLSIMNQVKYGTLTKQSMEALTTVYPKLYDELKANILDHLTTHIAKEKAPLPYQLKLSLGMFLGEDLDNSTSAQSILSSQMALQQAPQNRAQNQANTQARVSQTGLSKLQRSEGLMTPQQRTSQREA